MIAPRIKPTLVLRAGDCVAGSVGVPVGGDWVTDGLGKGVDVGGAGVNVSVGGGVMSRSSFWSA